MDSTITYLYLSAIHYLASYSIPSSISIWHSHEGDEPKPFGPTLIEYNLSIQDFSKPLYTAQTQYTYVYDYMYGHRPS